MTEAVSIHPTKGSDGLDEQLRTSLSDVDAEEFEQRVEQYGFNSKSEAARFFINIGMKSIVQNDPRDPQSTNDSIESEEEYDHRTIREFVPEGEENSVDVRDELLDKIDGELLNICMEDPEITVDNFQVYR